MPKEIILYDLLSREPCRSFSSNAWKIRLALNFKGIPYRTEWIPFIRLQENLKSFGLKPNPPGSWSEYSVPTVQWPDGTYLMDSAAIAEKLEEKCPEPSLRLNHGLQEEMQAAIMAVFIPIAPYLTYITMKNVIAPQDLEWFKGDRATRFGMTVEQLEEAGDPDRSYALARPGFEKCREVLTGHKRDEGPFILGSVPCFADFYLVGKILMLRSIGAEYIERFLEEAGPEITALYEACEEWTRRDD